MAKPHRPQNASVQQELVRERDRSRLLLEINNAVVSQLTLKDLLSAVSTHLRGVLTHDFAGIALCEGDGQHLRVYGLDFVASPELFPVGVLLPLKGLPSELTITSRRSFMRQRLDLAEFPSEAMEQALAAGLKSGCSVPLISHDRVLGTLEVGSFREGAFSEKDLELMEQIGKQIAIGVENSLNYERAQAAERAIALERDRLQLLLGINNAVVSCLDLQELLLAISASLRRVVGHDFAGLTVFDREHDRLILHAFDFPRPAIFAKEGTPIPIEGTPTGRAFRSRQTVLVRRVDVNEFPAEVVKQVTAEGVKSGCSAPLVFRDRAIGTLDILSTKEEAFSEEDALLLTQMAGQVAIAVANALAMRDLGALKEKLAEEKVYLEEEIQTEYDFEQIIGSSAALKRILKQVETVAPIDSTVLIRGETGTGKELIARAIHHLSNRKERALVKLNCAAIPTGLLESELFGHEKGAFTGAIAQRIGRFELAHRGTFFLDEVGDIPLELQPKLLRVLQEQEFERLGSARTQRVDVRLVAATNCDLERMVAEKAFRSDLYYRLNVFPIQIPPLRERTEDIPLLVRFFAQKFALRMRKSIRTIPAEANAALARYHWPGNVRELENFIERAVILSTGQELEVPLAELKRVDHERRKTDVAVSPSSCSSHLESVEREHILHVLRETQWVVAGPKGAAARLGMKRTTLQARMRKLGISRGHM